MPTLTLVGSVLVLLGMIFIAFTPRERVVTVTAPQYGTIVSVLNAEGTEATSMAAPYAEPGKVLAWDQERRMYRWVNEPGARN